MRMQKQRKTVNEAACDFLTFDIIPYFQAVSIAKNKIINPPSTKNKEEVLNPAFAFFLLIHGMNVVMREASIYTKSDFEFPPAKNFIPKFLQPYI